MVCISDEEKRLVSRVEDSIYLCNKRCAPCFLGFLDLREQALVRQQLGTCKTAEWRFFGGYEDAERAMLAVFPDYYGAEDIDYPFEAVAFRYRNSQKLSHRDFLGTLMAAGVRRDKIGDILCGDGLAVVFVCTEIVPYICDQVRRVGGEGVYISVGFDGDLPISREYKEIRDTIASPRLDAVIKALLRVSRDEAAQLVRTGFVSVDHRPCENVALNLSAPCTVSVRGYGRYLIDQFGPETQKGRLQFRARKCI